MNPRRRLPGQTCEKHLHFFTLMDCPGCAADRRRLKCDYYAVEDDMVYGCVQLLGHSGDHDPGSSGA